MTIIITSKKLDVDQPIFVGLDVHLKKMSVSVYHQDVEIGYCTLPSDAEVLKKYLQRFSLCKIKSVYEAGFSGFHLHYKLTEMGVENIVVAPNRVPKENGNFIKTDKRDAKRLAFSLAKGLLKGIHIPTKEQLAVRQIIRTREALKHKRRRAIQQIRMLLMQQNITFGHRLTKATKEMLKSLKMSEADKITIQILLDEIEVLVKNMRCLEKMAQRECQQDKYHKTYDILTSVPGIGPIIAAALCFEIGDFKRFSTGKKFSAYLGLTPREYSSGDSIRRGHITGQGNPWLRSYLVEAAWRTIAEDNAMQDTYNRLRQNTGSMKKAIVGVARKLCLRLHHLVTQQQNYAFGVVA